jgi:hypothetical protein
MESFPDRDHLGPPPLMVTSFDVLPRAPTVDERGAVVCPLESRDPKAILTDGVEDGSLPLELLRAHGPVERLQDELAAPPCMSLAAAERLRICRRSERRQDVDGWRH